MMGETEDAMHYDEEQIFKHLSVAFANDVEGFLD